MAPPGAPPIQLLNASQLLGAAAFACIAKYLPVYQAYIGLSRDTIGMLSFAGMITTFFGQIFWSCVIDCLRDYKAVLVWTQVGATALLFFYTLESVQNSVPLIFITAVCNAFLASTGGSIIDAMCMQVLKIYEEAAKCPTSTPRTIAGSQVTYGSTRLYSAVGWGGMSLVMGWLIDTFGINAMFVAFAAIQFTNVSLIVIFMPPPGEKEEDDGPQPTIMEVISNFDVVWFFSNLFIYGVSMCLIENYLFVYLVQEFDNVSNLLLGASTTIMCIFEIPVFQFISPWLESDREKGINTPRVTRVLVVCQVITAVRCWLYAIMPRNMAWLVMVVGSLQGISFAAMWVASMEYANRLATDSTRAKLTSLTNGLYYAVSMGVGSLMWGFLVEPTALGFRPSFKVDGLAMVIWSAIWIIGKCARGKAADTATTDALLNS